MENNIQTFVNAEFGEIRTMTIDDEPWFVGKDVAEILGYRDTVNALKLHVSEDDKLGWQITTSGQRRQVTIINESGLYSLILSSKLPQAKEFKHWITSEVLPTIRKHGVYMTKSAIDKYTVDKDAMDSLVETLKKEMLGRARAELKNQELKPIEDYYNQALVCPECYTMTQVAKGLKMTASELTHYLLSHKVIYHQSSQYLLYANYLHQGLAKNRTFEYKSEDGELHTRQYLVWTERGKNFIYQAVKGDLFN